MEEAQSARRAHWSAVYEANRPDELSWFQPCPEMSLKLIRRIDVPRTAAILDVGGGASTLVDHLIADGFANLAVLDLAATALARARTRLGERSACVDWIVADVTAWRPPATYDVWHDRAALHFLADPADQAGYARALRQALAPGGWALIAGVAPGGPAKCNGLDIVQHDGASIAALLGQGFALCETHGEVRETPWGGEQHLRYHVLQRRT